MSVSGKNIELTLSRICSGFVSLKGILYKHPSAKTIYKANLLYESLLDDEFTKEDALERLEDMGRWSSVLDQEVDVDIPKVIEQLKIELYQSYTVDKRQIPYIRAKLDKVKERLMSLLSIKHSLDEYTSEGLAEKEKTLYLIRKGCNLKEIAAETLLLSFYESSLSDTIVRSVARSSEWVAKWTALKKGVKVFSGNINQEQEFLVRWATVYENILEQEDCPEDEVVEDDDALDGWMIWKRREALRKKGLDEVENRIGNRNAQAHEVYLPINPNHPIFVPDEKSIEEGRRLNALNTPQAVSIKNQRFNQIEKAGTVNEFEVKDGRLVGGFADSQQRVNIARNVSSSRKQ